MKYLLLILFFIITTLGCYDEKQSKINKTSNKNSFTKEVNVWKSIKLKYFFLKERMSIVLQYNRKFLLPKNYIFCANEVKTNTNSYIIYKGSDLLMIPATKLRPFNLKKKLKIWKQFSGFYVKCSKNEVVKLKTLIKKIKRPLWNNTSYLETVIGKRKGLFLDNTFPVLFYFESYLHYGLLKNLTLVDCILLSKNVYSMTMYGYDYKNLTEKPFSKYEQALFRFEKTVSKRLYFDNEKIIFNGELFYKIQ